MALGPNQPLTEMSTKNSLLLGGKGDRCVGLTSLPPSCADCLEIWETAGTLKACPGLYWDCFTILFPPPLERCVRLSMHREKAPGK